MINESKYWKDDLLKLASKIELKTIQKRWGERNFYILEKDIFIGFYCIRKLIESSKISDSLRSKCYEVLEFPYKGKPDSMINYFNENEYDMSKGDASQITIAQICNQFIHSHHFLPFLPNGKNLAGLFFCSDYKRKSCIYLITLFDIADIFRAIGSNYPDKIEITRLTNGKLRTVVE